ncbi:formate dehydrogenase accessory sulfurtransferase FdhD [Caminibacter mediatlanticus]|uniref:Sulfur carrier protein FdhD n=1 Tax=Caminibacter mediatlanticus TB-2 TaxID=391592 RepID=A0AAI9F369_9BACT|nr:formate dehydrogenase accessory sulfurtransferase FdhD [Caminibacter mediatlanticus]EDM24544.1 formate dehydrogenase accessory protein [Caminibacter mediatlanticus TB-2]
MEPIYKFNIKKIKNGRIFDFEDTLIREVKLDIVINSKKVVSMMATPIDQEALAIGYLISEGIIKSIDDIKEINLLNDGMVVDIKAKINKSFDMLDEEGILISGCGKSVTANVDIDPKKIDATKITSNKKISTKFIVSQMKDFYNSCPLYEKTGCVHTARLYLDGVSYDAEDIAQHSTIDKACGKAILDGKNVENGILMVSGRLSSEMIVKAIMHRIPILISRTATTCLGAKIADFFNLTLVGFVRGENMNIYTHPERIIYEN